MCLHRPFPWSKRASRKGTPSRSSRRDTSEAATQPPAKPADIDTFRDRSFDDSQHGDLEDSTNTLSPKGTYEYTPLHGPEQFRLLKIWRNPDASSRALLCCDIEVFALSTSPPFTSLSYTWGSPFPEGKRDEEFGPDNLFTILIKSDSGSKTLDVRKNLFDGLYHLAEGGRTGYLWVDAICINEGNRTERAKQVSLMHRIFGKCSKVIIWLGVADEEVEDVTNLLDIVQQSPWMQVKDKDEAEFFYEWTSSGLAGSKQWLDEVLLPQAPLSDKRWMSYYRFLERAWFNRTWTVQEIALAPETHVLCGGIELSWRALTILAFMLSDTEYARVLTVYGQLATNRPRSRHAFVGHEIVQLSLCRALCQADKHPGLLDHIWGMQDPISRCLSLYQEALLVTWTRAASEPRDKVYGALGIALKNLPPHTQPPIKPDYTISVVRLYTKTSWMLLSRLRPLLLLSYAGRRRQRLEGLPSWALDFAGPDGTDNLTSANSKRGSLYWGTSISLPQNGPRSLKGDVLSLRGAMLDTIDEVHEINIFKVLKICLAIMPQYHTGQSPVEVLWRTLTATSSGPGAEQYRDAFKAWVYESIYKLETPHNKKTESVMAECFEYLNMIHTMQKSSDIPFTADIRGHTPGIDVSEKATIFRAMIRGHNIFRTSKGYIGTAPEGIKAGDQAWIMCDAITPLILRPVPNTQDRVLVRESYIHGFMHGEAKLADELQTISLR